jgi:hypothetical protein
MSNVQDPDYFRFRDYAEGFTNDSPVDLSGREGTPRIWTCDSCGVEGEEDIMDSHECKGEDSGTVNDTNTE